MMSWETLKRTLQGSQKATRTKGSGNGLSWVVGVAAVAFLVAPTCWASTDPFTPPKPEELSMTSVPGYPSIPAVVLYEERIDSGPLKSTTIYERIKVLNEDGKKYANVELAYRAA